ncbi:hypothetical protein L6R49_21355 [Myxococcota bacterium]|nr:hypothetical protein [Myxococcota bacterium]
MQRQRRRGPLQDRHRRRRPDRPRGDRGRHGSLQDRHRRRRHRRQGGDRPRH